MYMFFLLLERQFPLPPQVSKPSSRPISLVEEFPRSLQTWCCQSDSLLSELSEQKRTLRP